MWVVPFDLINISHDNSASMSENIKSAGEIDLFFPKVHCQRWMGKIACH